MAAPEFAASAFETVTAYLGWDHHHIQATLGLVSAAVERGDFVPAAREYATFEHCLLRHQRIEEELLFPVFEARSGIVGGPTAVMRDEHNQVKRALGLMRRGLEKEDRWEYSDGLRFLDSVLPDHNAKEEHILYPTLDALLSPKERAALVARLLRE